MCTHFLEFMTYLKVYYSISGIMYIWKYNTCHTLGQLGEFGDQTFTLFSIPKETFAFILYTHTTDIA